MRPAVDPEVLAASNDIITIGMRADEIRRRIHGTATTFVRVADVPVDAAAPVAIPPAAGEVRITGVPPSREGAVARVRAVADASRGVALSAFSLADLEELAARDGIALRPLLEEL